jgi:CheY-like chemotaxis protein
MTHRILLVDDHRDVIRLLRSALESLPHEFEILEAPSAEEAFLEISGSKIDLLVLDYLLPGMTGLELFDKFTKRNETAKVIFISGTKDRKARKQLEEADVYAFFEKPVSLTDFLDAVERALEVELTVIPDEDETHKTLASLLAKFRQNMEAQVITLVDDYGEIMAKAGTFPEDTQEEELLESLLGIYRASVKVARHIGQESPLSYHIFPGGELDIMLVPVNKKQALIVAGERLAERQKVLDMTDALMILKSEVAHVLSEMGLVDDIPVEELPDLSDIFAIDDIPEEQIEDEVSDEELEALFKQTDIGTADLQSFWDEAIDSHTPAQVDSDKLTYDQAKQLGLTPENNA